MGGVDMALDRDLVVGMLVAVMNGICVPLFGGFFDLFLDWLTMIGLLGLF